MYLISPYLIELLFRKMIVLSSNYYYYDYDWIMKIMFLVKIYQFAVH